MPYYLRIVLITFLLFFLQKTSCGSAGVIVLTRYRLTPLEGWPVHKTRQYHGLNITKCTKCFHIVSSSMDRFNLMTENYSVSCILTVVTLEVRLLAVTSRSAAA